MKKIDWNTYKFRASQTSKLLIGNLPNKDEYKARIEELEYERDNLINKNGNKVKWTENKQKELVSLIEKRDTPYFKLLPKTMTNELRKIHRSEVHNRNFDFTNKYVEKGNMEEENAITLYAKYRNEILGIKTFFLNNKKRVSNDWISGEVDLTDTNDVENCNEGFDIKCSWELETFPYSEDDLDPIYEAQNQSYMWLTGADKWTTAYCLVNTNEHLLHREKEKWKYTLGYHKIDMSTSDRQREKIENLVTQKMRDLEIRYIYDYDKFTNDNPGHLLEISRGEWYKNKYDIPLNKRVVEKFSNRNESLIEDLKNRIKISRDYLSYLDTL
jgi:hypothetical protein